MSLLLSKWFCRLGTIPTRFHLWCAERELRVNGAPTPGAQAARERNLDLLRAYRRRGDFPENAHNPTQLAPCFVDRDGRQCAVAFLMDQSGARAAAEKVAAEANHARIADMHFPELEAWAEGSGLTKAELARIQPGYPPTPEQAAKYAEIILSLWLVGGLAAVSISFNTCRLIWAFKPRLTTIVTGILLGLVLLYLSYRVEIREFTHTRLYEAVIDAQLVASGVGILAIVCAIIPLCVRRGKWPPSAFDTKADVLIAGKPEASSEHVKDLNL